MSLTVVRSRRKCRRALVDCDDVLSGFTKRVIELVYQKTGKLYREEDIHAWDLFEFIGDKALAKEIYAIIKSEEGCSSLDVLEGAKEGVKKLREACEEVVCVTAPFIGSRTWVHERYEWLKNHLGFNAHDVIHAHKKHAIDGSLFLDDKTDNVIKWGEHRLGMPCLWHRHANKNDVTPPWVSRVYSWEEVTELAWKLGAL